MGTPYPQFGLDVVCQTSTDLFQGVHEILKVDFMQNLGLFCGSQNRKHQGQTEIYADILTHT